jgi:hypothetical protein
MLCCHTLTSPFKVCFYNTSRCDSTDCVRVHAGNEIALYALLSGDSLPDPYQNTSIVQQSGYNVSIDGAPPETWPQREYSVFFQPGPDARTPVQSNALLVSAIFFLYPIWLMYERTRQYQRSGLESGDHYLVLTLTNASSFLKFDYAQTRSYSNTVQSSAASPITIACV